MGFFGAQALSKARGDNASHNELLHRLQCKVCPRNNDETLQHPKMLPSGAKRPEIIVLGEAPGKQEDVKGVQFIGESGQLLRRYIPDEWEDRIAFDNVIRCRPPNNRNPDEVEVECCRPKVATYIEHAKPKAVFGMGNFPLQWAIGQNGIMKWRGRQIPIKVGNHACWFFPMLHPAFFIHNNQNRRGPSKEEHVFGLDLKRAFDTLDDLPIPDPHDKTQIFSGIQSVDWKQPGAAKTIVAFLDHACNEKDAGLDFETHRLRPYYADAKVLSIAVAIRGKALAFPYDHPEAKWSPEDKKTIHKTFLRFLCAPVRKVAHNLAFEMEWAAVKFGNALLPQTYRDILRSSPWDDSMSQAGVLDERTGGKPDQENPKTDTSCLGLGFITLLLFGTNIKTLSDVDTKNMMAEPLAKILPYNAVDAKYCLEAFWTQQPLLAAENLQHIYQMNLARISTVVLTQIKGLPVDFGMADKLHDKLSDQVTTAELAIKADKHVAKYKEKYRVEFKPGSDPACVKMFRDIVKSDEGETKNRDGTTSYSVTKDVLERIDVPIAAKVLAWRAPQKLLSTYIWTRNHKFIYPDGKLHPVLNTLSTVTGRLSGEDPNQQNMPKRSEQGKEIRKQIRAPKGHLICSVDYGQIEARCIAMVSKDKIFVKALWEDYDVHMEWAQRLAKKRPSLIGHGLVQNMKDLRQKVKSDWVFAAFFGAQQSTVESHMGVPEGTFSAEYEEFWRIFSGVRDWQEEQLRLFRDRGYVETLMGRRRRAPISINQVINNTIQGLAADIVLDGMNALSELDDWYFQPILNVHDDLTSIFPVENFDWYVEKKIDTLLTKTYPFLNVPLQVELSLGENLCDMVDGGKFSSNKWKQAV